MSVLAVASPELHGIAKDLFSDHCVVAITPVAGEFEWAENVAWTIARAAASTGRRTALIDLSLDDPRLHKQAAHAKDTGIVDAFLFGASLQHVASKEEDANLHFIGVGTPPLEPEEVWASDRWQRLFRGFKKEEALLLLFMPTEALDALTLPPDLIVALAPSGFDSGGPRAPQLRSAIDRGIPLAVVTDGPDPAPETPAVDSESRVAPVEEPTDATRRASSLPRKILLSLLGVAIAATVAIAILRQSNGNAVQLQNEPAPDSILTEISADSPPRAATPALEPEVAAEEGPDSAISEQEADELPALQAPSIEAESLPYSIQVAAWGQRSQALEHVAQFYGAGTAATITAVPRDSARVWYRVVVGAVSDYSAAAELRERLRADGLIGSTRGVLIETPLSLLLETLPDTVSAGEAVRGLRESGIPAYIVSMPDGTAQVLLGAFESPDQADLINSVLPEVGRNLSRTLVSRVGIAR